jgi:hypothetical protein
MNRRKFTTAMGAVAGSKAFGDQRIAAFRLLPARHAVNAYVDAIRGDGPAAPQRGRSVEKAE